MLKHLETATDRVEETQGRKRRRRFHKAQIFTWDLILASIIFMVILSIIVYMWGGILQNIEATEIENDMTWMSTAVAEQLVRTPGSPANWTLCPVLDNVTILGLADIQQTANSTKTLDRVLDADKVLYFVNFTEHQYAAVRNKLIASGRYGVYLELSCLERNESICFDGLPIETVRNGNVTCGNNFTFYIENNTLTTNQGLVGFWRFDEGSGYGTADSSAQKNNGAIPLTLIDDFSEGESWSEHHLNSTAYGGTYQARIAGNDPYFSRDIPDFNASFDYLIMRYKSYVGGPAAVGVYYTDSNSCGGYSETCAQHGIPIYADGFWHTLEAKITDPEWVDGGNITQIRFDFESFSTNDTVYLDYILLRSGPNWTAGLYDSGLEFDGVDDYINIGRPSVDFNDATLSAWINTSAATGQKPLVYTGYGGGETEYIGMIVENSKIRIDWDAGDDGGGRKSVYSTSNIADGSWHHVAATFEGGVIERVYIDSIMENSNSLAAAEAQVNPAVNWTIGGMLSLNLYFNGTIDDVKIWNRALTEEEILAEYEHGEKICRFGDNITLDKVDYQFYDTKIVTFTTEANQSVLNDTSFRDPTMKFTVVVYKETPTTTTTTL